MRLPFFARDRRGGAALEFAVIASVMLPLCVAMAEMHFRFDAGQRIMVSAALTADLVAQRTVVNAAALEEIRDATRASLAPLDTTSLVIDIASLRLDTAGGTPVVEWRHSNGAQLLRSGDISSAKTLMQVGETAIWVGVRYEYTSPVALMTSASSTYEHVAYARPRLTDRIQFK